MSYYRQYRRSKPETIPASDELSSRINRVAVELKPHLTDWEKGFIESVSEAYEKWNGLTIGQNRVFEKIEKKYNRDTLEAAAAWNSAFDAEKREILKLVTDYYRPTGYFSGLISKIDTDPDFIPSESTWKKFVENKYATKVLAAAEKESNFATGGFALLRDTFRPRGPGVWGDARVIGHAIADRRGRTVLVLKPSDRLSTDKVWWAAYIDNPTAMWEIEERWLKRHRRR